MGNLVLRVLACNLTPAFSCFEGFGQACLHACKLGWQRFKHAEGSADQGVNALHRYLEVRRQMMQSPEGRRALLEGVPDVVLEVAEIDRILQARS